MRALYFADVHDQAENMDILPYRDVDSVYCLGDVFISDPDAAMKSIRKLKEMDARCVWGQHDRAIFDEESLERYRAGSQNGHPRSGANFDNYQNALRLRQSMGEESIQWMQQWEDPVLKDTLDGKYDVVMVHDCLPGTRLEPDEAEKMFGEPLYKGRIITSRHAERNFDSMGFNLLFHGHIHHPQMWTHKYDFVREFMPYDSFRRADVSRWGRYIICPGSMCGDSGHELLPGRETELSKSGSTCSFAILDTDAGPDPDTALLTLHFYSKRKSGEWAPLMET